jgi:hypothetical protein
MPNINSYFSNFSTIEYNNLQILNIFDNIDLDTEYMQNNYMFEEYKIEVGDTPEDVAFKFYNNKHLYWLILKINKKLNYFFDWPLTDDELKNHMDKYYVEKATEILDLAVLQYVREYTGTGDLKTDEVKSDYESDVTNGLTTDLTEAIDENMSNIEDKIYYQFYDQNNQNRYIKVLKNEYLVDLLEKIKQR